MNYFLYKKNNKKNSIVTEKILKLKNNRTKSAKILLESFTCCYQYSKYQYSKVTAVVLTINVFSKAVFSETGLTLV